MKPTNMLQVATHSVAFGTKPKQAIFAGAERSWGRGLIAILAFSLSGAVRAQTYINNRDQVPLWNQHHDYRDTYRNLPSAIPDGMGGFVTYGNLCGDARVFIAPPLGWRYSVNPAPPRAQFMPADFYGAGGADLAGGGWHCFPTSTGMWMEWLRQNSLQRLPNRGGEVASISGFAQDADTNQQRDVVTDGIGKLGTFRDKMIQAADGYVASAYGAAFSRPGIRFWKYTPNAFRQTIDRNKPPVVMYRNAAPNNNGGHAVVGVGYNSDTNQIIVRDPWDGAEKPKGMDTIRDMSDGGGGIPFGDNPQSADFDLPWEARLMVMEIPNRGSAPYPYYLQPASHLSALREWLGAGVIPDVDPLDPPQDDGEGIRFLGMNPDGTARLEATISSKSDMVNENDLPPVLYLNGWIDWNNDGVWDPATEQIIHWSGPADFEGSITLTFDYQIPPGVEPPFWARFRLDRGQNIGPYGDAEFGEIEDYYLCHFGG